MDPPIYPETYEYINYRLIAMRHADTAWGLGSFYSMEATSLEYTLGHFRQLRRFGVPVHHVQVYEDHDTIDEEHTSEIVQVIHRLATEPESQATCLASQRHQMQLWHAHFDRVHEEIND